MLYYSISVTSVREYINLGAIYIQCNALLHQHYAGMPGLDHQLTLINDTEFNIIDHNWEAPLCRPSFLVPPIPLLDNKLLWHSVFHAVYD